VAPVLHRVCNLPTLAPNLPPPLTDDNRVKLSAVVQALHLHLSKLGSALALEGAGISQAARDGIQRVAADLAAYQTELESFVTRVEQGLLGLGEQLGQGLGAVSTQLQRVERKLDQLATAQQGGQGGAATAAAGGTTPLATSTRKVKGARYRAEQLSQATEVRGNGGSQVPFYWLSCCKRRPSKT
jgi:hypothetical protein